MASHSSCSRGPSSMFSAGQQLTLEAEHRKGNQDHVHLLRCQQKGEYIIKYPRDHRTLGFRNGCIQALNLYVQPLSISAGLPTTYSRATHQLAETSSGKIPRKCPAEDSDWLGTGHMLALDPIRVQNNERLQWSQIHSLVVYEAKFPMKCFLGRGKQF